MEHKNDFIEAIRVCLNLTDFMCFNNQGSLLIQFSTGILKKPLLELTVAFLCWSWTTLPFVFSRGILSLSLFYFFLPPLLPSHEGYEKYPPGSNFIHSICVDYKRLYMVGLFWKQVLSQEFKWKWFMLWRKSQDKPLREWGKEDSEGKKQTQVLFI